MTTGGAARTPAAKLKRAGVEGGVAVPDAELELGGSSEIGTSLLGHTPGRSLYKEGGNDHGERQHQQQIERHPVITGEIVA
jgi:hypothetical protein